MKRETQPTERPNLQKLKSAITEYLENHECGVTIRGSAEILKIDEGQKINSLSGSCVGQTTNLNEYLNNNGIPTKVVKSKNMQVHTFLKCQTSKSEIIIDPTIGQFIAYPDIFVGTLDELRLLFLSPERELLVGKRLWAVKHDITSREEWFKILYEI